MSAVNIPSIRKKISRSAQLAKEAERVINTRFDREKEKYLDSFNSHPVTKEIEAGPKSSNLSNTLGGIGNLFSFIGFDRGDDPIQKIRNYINSNFKLSRPKISSKGDKVRLDFQIKYPSLEDLKTISPMPWEEGRSWISSIERGISGFSNYVYKKFVEGRSGEALQSEKRIRGSTYKSIKYMSEIINEFIKGIKK